MDRRPANNQSGWRGLFVAEEQLAYVLSLRHSICTRFSVSCREASFQRQRLLQAVERVQAAKNFSALASGNLDAFTR